MTLTLLEYYFLLFFIASFLGWCMEVTGKYFVYHRFINRGMLTGPCLPIYGAGACIVTIIVGLVPGREAVPCALVGLFHKALQPQWSDLCQYADSLWPAGTDHGLLGEADFIRIVRPAFGISAGDHLYILAGADDD